MHFLKCRRTFVSVLAIVCLTAVGVTKGVDVSAAIAAVAMGLAGANAYEKRGRNEKEHAKQKDYIETR